MIAGFTGTQRDITAKQFDALLEVITTIRPVAIHHGDCIGADHRFHQICAWLNHENPNYQIAIHIHPPLSNAKRANCDDATEIWPQKDYLVRNHDIVDCSDVLIVCPRTQKEQQRSGTWATYRYAKKQDKPTFLILPNGTVE
jgi:hypothetical protein